MPRPRLALLFALLPVVLAAALSACDLARPWPVAPASSPRHHAVLMIGDSLVGQTDTELAAAFDRAGLDVEVIDAHVNASGLLGPVGDAPTALGWVQEQVAARPEVSTVVIEWAGACGLACDPAQPDFVEYGSSAFYTQWTANAHAIIDWLHTQGKYVVWVVSPPFGVDLAAGPAAQLRSEVAAELADRARNDFAGRAGGPLVDWSAALTNVFGEYRTELVYDGARFTVRTSDLVHLTMAGAERTSRWTVTPLAQLWLTTPGAAVAGPLDGSRVVEAGDPVTLDVPPGP